MSDDQWVNLTTVTLDVVIVLECWSCALWFLGGVKNTLMWALGIGFIFITFGFLMVALGDVALALGFRADDLWFLSRIGRALPSRALWAIAFTLITATLRFGKWIR